MANTVKRKLLLLGKSGAGKTSMRSIIFSNYLAKDTRRLGATIDVEHSNVRLLGNLVLNLFDCAGQTNFQKNFLTSQRDQIFRNVQVLVYVFDVSSELQEDLDFYIKCLQALNEYSKHAKVVCLVHKMDLLPADTREAQYQHYEQTLKHVSSEYHMTVDLFATSIWDESLYHAWSNIVISLIPNIHQLETHLESFYNLLKAHEIIVFEKTTFLVITHLPNKARNHHRFEKMSNIVKQFKLSCSRMQSKFQGMEIQSDEVKLILDCLTSNTYILVAVKDDIELAIVKYNIQQARQLFEGLW
eukprot:NODE_527_length_6442_cov_0.831941.p3 type:complete len:300 gc:universal NODE_527_length_6442_cov_0.831941:1159-260(-)